MSIYSLDRIVVQSTVEDAYRLLRALPVKSVEPQPQPLTLVMSFDPSNASRGSPGSPDSEALPVTPCDLFPDDAQIKVAPKAGKMKARRRRLAVGIWCELCNYEAHRSDVFRCHLRSRKHINNFAEFEVAGLDTLDQPHPSVEPNTHAEVSYLTPSKTSYQPSLFESSCAPVHGTGLPSMQLPTCPALDAGLVSGPPLLDHSTGSQTPSYFHETAHQQGYGFVDLSDPTLDIMNGLDFGAFINALNNMPIPDAAGGSSASASGSNTTLGYAGSQPDTAGNTYFTHYQYLPPDEFLASRSLDVDTSIAKEFGPLVGLFGNTYDSALLAADSAFC